MENINLIATTKFGLERVVKNELKMLGFDNLRTGNGRIEFDATLADIPKANLWLRCADRVLLKIGEFKSLDFEELFEQTKALPWEKWIPQDGAFPVNARVVKSKINSVRSTQSIVKKAIVERLKEAYGAEWLPESGAEFGVLASILQDTVLLTLDTSGAGLHKRGYRERGGEAPLKETLGAALVLLSFWNKDRLLIDPMCGSGTILIEAAMVARNMAPGLNRDFASEYWPLIEDDVWREARETAVSLQTSNPNLQIYGYDIDSDSIYFAKQNAENAGVADNITFAQKDVKDLWIDQQYGILISNPPYGVRLSGYQDLNRIYIELHKTFRKKQGWSVYILTADKMFPKYFKRARPNRVRKLYNGRIEANYYQYHGEKPRN